MCGNRDRQERRVVGDTGDEAIERDDQKDRAGGQGTAETGDEGRPAGQKAGQRPKGFAEINILAAGLRPQRRELGICRLAPMNASTPPPAQARRNHVASGIAAATAGERRGCRRR